MKLNRHVVGARLPFWKFSDLIKKYPQYFVWEEGREDTSGNTLIVTRVKNRDTAGSLDPTIAAAV